MGGIVSGVKSLISGPEKPKSFSAQQSLNDQIKAAQAKAKYGLYGVENSPFGSTRTTEDPETGMISREFDISPDDIRRNQLVSQGLAGLSLDPTQAENAFYNRATRQLLPRFEESRESLEERLINQGLEPTSQQYRTRLRDLTEGQQGTLADLANQSIFAGQNLLGSQIGNIGALGAGRDIYSLASLASPTGAQIGSSLPGAVDSQNYANQMKNQQAFGGLSSLVQLGSLFF